MLSLCCINVVQSLLWVDSTRGGFLLLAFHLLFLWAAGTFLGGGWNFCLGVCTEQWNEAGVPLKGLPVGHGCDVALAPAARVPRGQSCRFFLLILWEIGFWDTVHRTVREVEFGTRN